MNNEKKPIDELLELGKANGYVSSKDIAKYYDEDTDEFDEVRNMLEDNEITIVEDDNIDDELEKIEDDFDGFIGKMENDPEFTEFNMK